MNYAFPSIFEDLRDDDHTAVPTFQSALDATPFWELILQSIPVNTIRVETERILWHQRLSHPCDEYLYSAHKFIDGVPKFKQRSNVIHVKMFHLYQDEADKDYSWS